MPTTVAERRLRALCEARLAVAAADALASTRLEGRLERSVVRVLAGRQVIQAAVTLARPSRRVVGAGAVVDALHSLSMVGLAARGPEHRRGGLTEAATAGALAAAGALMSLDWAPPG